MARHLLVAFLLVLGCSSLVSARFLPITPPVMSTTQPLISTPEGGSDKLEPDPYETLKKNGLPVGLLPNTAIKAEINAQGWFRVQLSSTCRTSVHNTGQIPLYYSTVLTGKLDYGKVSNVRGISAKIPELPLWVSVSSIYVDNPDSELIHFSVGFGIGEQLPRAAFNDFPICHSGVEAALETREEDAIPIEFQGQEEPFEVAILEAIKAAEEEEANAAEAAQAAARNREEQEDPALVVVEAMTSDVVMTSDDLGEEEGFDVSVEDDGTMEATGGDAGDAGGAGDDGQQDGGAQEEEVAVAAA